MFCVRVVDWKVLCESRGLECFVRESWIGMFCLSVVDWNVLCESCGLESFV